MTVMEAIEKRRAVKHFDPGHLMPGSDFERLLGLTLLSPTSFNMQNWRFVRVSDPALRQKIREAAYDQPQVTEASLLIVMCADNSAWKQPEKYWFNAPPEVQQKIIPVIRDFYEGRPRLQRDEGLRSCAIAAQTLMLAAKEMGYDSCPMSGFDFQRVSELICLPEDHEVSLMLAIGRATGSAYPRPGQLSLRDVVIENHF